MHDKTLHRPTEINQNSIAAKSTFLSRSRLLHSIFTFSLSSTLNEKPSHTNLHETFTIIFGEEFQPMPRIKNAPACGKSNSLARSRIFISRIFVRGDNFASQYMYSARLRKNYCRISLEKEYTYIYLYITYVRHARSV